MANKDKSKGKKEPTVSKKEKDQKAAELVLSIGVEGGGFSIYRTPLASGGWQFHEQGMGGGMWILDELDEDSDICPPEPVQTKEAQKPVQTIQEAVEPVKTIQEAVEPVRSIQEALRSIAEDGSWVLWFPISIHPEYRYDIWELVQEIVLTLPDNKKRYWADRSGKKWQRLLRRKVRLEPLPTPEKKTKPAKTLKPTKRPKKTPMLDLFGNVMGEDAD